jgi:hypothetical protein
MLLKYEWGDYMTKQCYYCSYPNSDSATRCINCGMELKTYWDKSDGNIRLVKDSKND